MKYLLLFLITLSLGAGSRQTVIRDRSGRPVAVITDSKGSQVIRDRSGRVIAVGRQTGNKTLYRDASGRPIATKTERKK